MSTKCVSHDFLREYNYYWREWASVNSLVSLQLLSWSSLLWCLWERLRRRPCHKGVLCSWSGWRLCCTFSLSPTGLRATSCQVLSWSHRKYGTGLVDVGGISHAVSSSWRFVQCTLPPWIMRVLRRRSLLLVASLFCFAGFLASPCMDDQLGWRCDRFGKAAHFLSWGEW